MKWITPFFIGTFGFTRRLQFTSLSPFGAHVILILSPDIASTSVPGSSSGLYCSDLRMWASGLIAALVWLPYASMGAKIVTPHVSEKTESLPQDLTEL